MTGDTPLISCVVPAFNAERYLAETLESILAQTYRPIEVIVADDGSTDGTRAIAERYGAEVRFETQPTAGPAATRNFGVRRARGGFLSFLDADDLWHPEKLARQMARFRARPELRASTTHVQMFWVPGLEEEREQYGDHPRSRPVPGYATTTLLVERSAFDAVGPFRENLWFADATDWFLRAREAGLEIELLPDVLVYHRMHEQNLTRRRSAASRDEFARVMKESLDRRRRQGTLGGDAPGVS